LAWVWGFQKQLFGSEKQRKTICNLPAFFNRNGAKAQRCLGISKSLFAALPLDVKLDIDGTGCFFVWKSRGRSCAHLSEPEFVQW
jgi:hypothetical protein